MWLDLSEWVNPPAATAGVSCTYALKAVVMHVGSPTHGHYYAYVRRGAVDYGGGKACWVKLDDDEVERVSEDQVLADAFGGGKTGTMAPSYSGKFAKVRSIYILSP